MSHHITWTGDCEVAAMFASSSNDKKWLDAVAQYNSKTRKTRFFWRVMVGYKTVKRTSSFQAAIKAYNAA